MVNNTYREVPLNGVLHRYISCFWWEELADKKVSPTKHFVIPDNTIELIFSTTPFYRRELKQGKQEQLFSHLAGLKTQAQICSVEAPPLISLRFKPHGLYPFSSYPIKATIDTSIKPEGFFGAEIKTVEQELFRLNSQEERMELLSNFFEEKLRKSTVEIDVLFEKILQSIEATSGSISIQYLCKQYQVSYKTIERKFIKKLGIPPKKYCRLLRTINCLKAGKNYKHKEVELTRLAYQYQYSDQSHFIKEVKALTYFPPRHFYQLSRGIQSVFFG